MAAAAAVLALAGCGGGEEASTPAQAAGERLEVLGASMEPTLHCARPTVGCRAGREDEVVVRDETQIERREIVAFQVGAKARRECGAGGLFIKRVIGVAGDAVAIRDGSVYLNGRKLREPYANGPTDGAARYDVPAEHVFVLGDNRAQSCDSRVWGPLAVRRVVGVAYEVRRGSRRLALP
ncbi:MAG TPA: signal peptidase I [Gaiellaceae bacterium]|nr:signal peptidase I [Gaiellaceae bacterium]